MLQKSADGKEVISGSSLVDSNQMFRTSVNSENSTSSVVTASVNCNEMSSNEQVMQMFRQQVQSLEAELVSHEVAYKQKLQLIKNYKTKVRKYQRENQKLKVHLLFKVEGRFKSPVQ